MNLSSLPKRRSCPVQVPEGTGSVCHQTFGLSRPEIHGCTADGKDELSLQIPTPVCEGVQLRRGLPTVIDRVVQQAITQVLSPIYEKKFSPNTYGFRPKRSAHQALNKCKDHITDGGAEGRNGK